MPKNKTILFINTGSGKNLGDRAMLLNLASLCKNNGVKKIYVTSDFPKFLSEELSAINYPLLYHCFGRFKAAERKPFFKALITTFATIFAFIILLLRVVNKKALSWTFMEAKLANAIVDSDLVVFSGGGYLTDKGMLECRASLLTGLLASIIGKQVVMSGVGIGPLDSKISGFLLSRIAKVANAIMVRDPFESKDLLLKLNVNQEKIMPIGDDAFTLPAKMQNGPTDTPNLKLLAVHFRISNFTVNAEQIANSLLSALKHHEQQGWFIRFFIFSEISRHELDIINKIFSNKLSHYEVIQSRDPRELKFKISECQLAIGIAYHFLIFALTTGVPTIGLYDGDYYKQKVCGLFSWFDMEESALQFTEINQPEITRRFNQLICNNENIKAQLLTRTEILSRQCFEFYSKYIF